MSAAPITLNDLQRLRDQAAANFQQQHPSAAAWLSRNKPEWREIFEAAQKFLAVTTIAGSMLLQPKPVDVRVAEEVQALAQETHSELLSTITEEERQVIMDKMKTLVMQPAGHLSRQDELYLEQQLSDMLGFQVSAELEGHRLNHSIGIMGSEQHLKRFPTDTLEQHDAFREAGMAPNRGAFGWFTEQGQLTEEAIMREKYYFAVQTLYLPDWNTNHAELKPWYKFRKMVVINPHDGVAVVGVVGDAGPAQWVQKQFGGSPEVIREGRIWSKQARGHVMLFFVDDPENKIPLGVRSLELPTTLAQGGV